MRTNISIPPNGYKNAILLILTLILAILIVLHYIHDNSSKINAGISGPLHGGNNKSSSALQHDKVNGIGMRRVGNKCNMFSGKWVPYPKGPYYTNNTRCYITDGQNCMKFGRPDTEFMKWRWRPDDCELPLFDAAQFMELVRGKSMAFVGDSVARNQAQSLLCLLANVATAVEKPYAKYPKSRRWFYPEYNFTLALLMTTHLVKALGVSSSSMNLELYLDEVDEEWASPVEDFDYVLISSGHWFSRPLMYYEKGKFIGCNTCSEEAVRVQGKYLGYRKVFRTAFRMFLDSQKFKGTVILRTITPTHFEKEDSEGRGNCVRTRPYRRDEVKLDWNIWQYYLIQVEEFWAAKREAEKIGKKFELLDITEAMSPRPDGHPNHYGHVLEERFMLYSDCLHWCLPGPIDMWNELLIQIMMRKEGQDVI
ncbi:hypothetical protein CsSME_00004017 [Camellia sinensis var. sinensis]